MKKAALFAAGLFFTLMGTAQEKKTVVAGNGHIAKETRDITTFEKVTVNGNFEVTLVSGDAGTIKLEGEDNLLALITTEVKNGTLTIDSKHSQFLKPSRNKTITIKVPVQSITEVVLNGSGTINVKKRIKNDIKAVVDGSGSINLTTSNNDVAAWVLGSGEINIEGKTQTLDCRVIGSGTVVATSLEANYVSALVSGCGDVKANSIKSIKGRISGSGNIAFAGEPVETDLKHSGTGKFSRY